MATSHPRQRAEQPAEDELRLHPLDRGKMQMMPKCPVHGIDDFAVWYTPGAAASSRAIVADPDLVWSHTKGQHDRHRFGRLASARTR